MYKQIEKYKLGNCENVNAVEEKMTKNLGNKGKICQGGKGRVEEALGSPDFIDFLWIVNERRPYCKWDFVPQTFIPDLDDYCR